MGNEIKYIETKKEKYPLLFSLNVMEAMQNEYGTLSRWSELLEPGTGKEPNLKAVLFLFKELINEGIDYENEEKNETRVFINERTAGRIMTEIGFKNIVSQLKGIVTTSTSQKKDEDENDEKNLMTTQNQ